MSRGCVCRAALLSVAAAAFAVASVTAADADDKKPKKQKPRQVIETGAEDAAGPTAQQAAAEQAMEQMLRRDAEGLVVVTDEHGMKSADLEGRFMHVLVSVTRPDGTVGVDCLTSHEHLETSPTPAAASPGGASAPSAKPAPKTPVLEERD
jgi:hypothetical protein